MGNELAANLLSMVSFSTRRRLLGEKMEDHSDRKKLLLHEPSHLCNTRPILPGQFPSRNHESGVDFVKGSLL